VGRVPFRYMIDQLSRSDARADGEDTVSVDADYQHTPDHHDDADIQTLSASEDLASAVDVKQVLLFISIFLNFLTIIKIIMFRMAMSIGLFLLSHPTSSRTSSHSNMCFQILLLALWYFTSLGIITANNLNKKIIFVYYSCRTRQQNQQAVTHDSTDTIECKASTQPNITQGLARLQ